VALAGLLTRETLLDLMRNFVVFERDSSSGRIIRKLCRYQTVRCREQGRAACSHGQEGNRSRRRGLAHPGIGQEPDHAVAGAQLRNDPRQDNPTLVIVTDRTDLDDQITKTFRACGFRNPEQAESVRHLRELLSGPTGKTILTTVQKFQELTASEPGGEAIAPRTPPCHWPATSSC